MGAATAGGRLRFGVLGAVRVWRDGAEVQLGGQQTCVLLAVLLAAGGRTVTLDEIIYILWPHTAPSTAVNIVHQRVRALRRLLEPDLGTRAQGHWLLRAAAGYVFSADDVTLDLLRFRRLVAEAAELAGAGDRGTAARRWAEALSLWRGRCASDLRQEQRASPIFQAVDQEYQAATRDAVGAALAVGQPELVQAAAHRAADWEPLDEAAQARLLLVLAATGRQADALARYQQVRARLAEELGIDPSEELRAAHQRVLRQDLSPTGGITGAGPAAGSPATLEHRCPWPTPAQLPAMTPGFVGRTAELAWLDDVLTETGQTHAPVVVTGPAGVGKTALVVRWAHRVAGRFPDGQLYVNLRGFDPSGTPLPAAEALHGFLGALGVPAEQVPADLDARGALYRSLLAGRRVLVVLDNAHDAEQVRPLQPGSPGCLTVVTSRSPLRGIVAAQGARPLPLDVLSLDEARRLLAHRLGEGRVAAEPDAVDVIVHRCARLPLALAIVSAQAATHRGFPLRLLAQQLRKAGNGLDAFADADTDVDLRAAFSSSYRAVNAGAARLFRLLGRCSGCGFRVSTAASLAGVSTPTARSLLAELERVHLVTEYTPDWFTLHQLHRAYAVELADTSERGLSRRAAGSERLVEHGTLQPSGCAVARVGGCRTAQT